MSTETLIFPDDHTPLDLLLWRRYRTEAPGLVEQTLAANYDLPLSGDPPPRGTSVVVTAPTPATKTRVKKSIKLYG